MAAKTPVLLKKAPVAKKTPATKAPVTKKTPAAEPAEPKVRVSASEEEIAAAVAGNLEPRETVGDKRQESLTAVSENGRAKGRPLGVTTGLPIMLCWCYVYQQNEKAAPKDKLSDEDISAFMKSEFPGREVGVFEVGGVQYCRRLYNSGRFTKGTQPKTQSHRYNAEGQVDDPTRGGGNGKAPKAPAAKAVAKTPAVAKKAVAKAPVAKTVAKRAVKVPA
jgi:hypothetical protein